MNVWCYDGLMKWHLAVMTYKGPSGHFEIMWHCHHHPTSAVMMCMTSAITWLWHGYVSLIKQSSSKVLSNCLRIYTPPWSARLNVYSSNHGNHVCVCVLMRLLTPPVQTGVTVGYMVGRVGVWPEDHLCSVKSVCCCSWYGCVQDYGKCMCVLDQ